MHYITLFLLFCRGPRVLIVRGGGWAKSAGSAGSFSTILLGNNVEPSRFCLFRPYLDHTVDTGQPLDYLVSAHRGSTVRLCPPVEEPAQFGGSSKSAGRHFFPCRKVPAVLRPNDGHLFRHPLADPVRRDLKLLDHVTASG